MNAEAKQVQGQAIAAVLPYMPSTATPLSPPPVDQIAAALVKAQLEIQNPPLDSTNPHFKSRFASLPGVRNAIVPIMAKHGIAVIQDLQSNDKGAVCTTILLHSSGQRMTLGPLFVPSTKVDAQGLGSAATYARRYALLALACVAGEEDDDGNGAAAPNKADRISEKQIADLIALCDEVGADQEKLKKYLKVGSFAELRISEYASVIAKVEAKRG